MALRFGICPQCNQLKRIGRTKSRCKTCRIGNRTIDPNTPFRSKKKGKFCSICKARLSKDKKPCKNCRRQHAGKSHFMNGNLVK